MKRFFNKLKTRWGVGTWGVIAVLLAFSLAGMSVVQVKRPILAAVTPHGAPMWMRVVLYILIVLPLYQVLLLIWGTILGQFRFFWTKLKRTWRFLFGWMLPAPAQTKSSEEA